MLYHEFYLNSMALPSSVYAKAADLGVSVDEAFPANVSSVLRLDMAAMFAAGTGAGTRRTVALAREDLVFRLGDFRYMLPFDLEVTIESSGGGTAFAVFQAKYDLSKEEPATGLRDRYALHPFVRVVSLPRSLENHAYVQADLWQLSRRTEDFTVLSDIQAERILFEGRLDPQLAGRIVHYRPTDDAAFRVVKSYPVGTLPPENEVEYAWWRQTGDDGFALSFPTVESAFRPAYQSTVRVETFSTSGAAGNFQYTAEPTLSATDAAGVTGVSLLDGFRTSSGGKDRPDLRTMKRRLLGAVRRTDLLVTEEDLRSRLETAATTAFGSDFDLKMVRERDDVVSRRFAAYALLRSDANTVLGTRSQDVWIPPSRLAASSGEWSVVPAGTLARVNTATNRMELYDATQPTSAEREWREGAEPVYALIHTARLKRGVDRVVAETAFRTVDTAMWHQTSFRKEGRVRFVFSSTAAEAGVAFESVVLERNAVEDDRALATIVAASLDEDNPIKDATAVLIFKEKDTGEVLGAAEAAWDDVGGSFRAEITVLDETIDNEGGIGAEMLDADGAAARVQLPSRFAMEVALLWPGDSISGDTLEKAKERNALFTTDLFAARWNSGPAPLRVSAIGEVDGEWTMCDDLSDVVYTAASNKVSATESAAWLAGMPLMDHRIVYSGVRYASVLRRLDVFAAELRKVISLLRDQTDISLRFHNTRGASNRWTVGRVDMSMGIRLAVSRGAETHDLENRVKRFVERFVARHGESDDNVFSFSRMFADMHLEVPEVLSARLIELNGERGLDRIDHYIRETSTWKAQPLSSRVPELLSVRTRHAGDGAEIGPDIDITYEESSA